MSYDYTNYPLPPEWEQKYDWESKRFFFVDHFNKKTTWIDPRIELYKKDHEVESTNENSALNDPLGVLRMPSNRNKQTSSACTSREKKAFELHQKYPEYPLDKIMDMLEKNYDNVSSVESVIQREQQIKIQNEQEEKQKQLEMAAKKAEKEENERRIKEETEKRIKEETEKRLKEENEKRIKEEAEKRIKADNEKRFKEESEKRSKLESNKKVKDDLLKQKIQLDTKIKSKEIEIQKLNENVNKNDQTVKLKVEEDKRKNMENQNSLKPDQKENQLDEMNKSNFPEPLDQHVIKSLKQRYRMNLLIKLVAQSINDGMISALQNNTDSDLSGYNFIDEDNVPMVGLYKSILGDNNLTENEIMDWANGINETFISNHIEENNETVNDEISTNEENRVKNSKNINDVINSFNIVC